MDLRVNLSSCVPATQFETSGAALSAADLLSVREHPKVTGLAEFMNFPACSPATRKRWRSSPPSRTAISMAMRPFCPGAT
jgi:adenine deaminase